jgi:hypothetical protein
VVEAGGCGHERIIEAACEDSGWGR